MSIIKEERVLCVILNLSLALRLSSHVIIVAGFENIIIFLLIVGNVASLRSLNQLECPLKKTLSIGVSQHFWMIIIN